MFLPSNCPVSPNPPADETLDNLLEELQSLSPTDKDKPKVYDQVDGGSVRPVRAPASSTPSARQPAQSSQPPPPVEEDLPKIRNIYDELKPQSLGEPPPKPPRQTQASPPRQRKKQPAATTNGVAPGGREGKANVSELDALLETLGSNVPQKADIVSGTHGHAWTEGWVVAELSVCMPDVVCCAAD